MQNKRTAFFISDRTGITVEMLGHSLLTQFDGVEFKQVTIPFVDTVEKAAEVANQINQVALAEGSCPLVFSTLVNPEISAMVAAANALFMDFFQVFTDPLESELGVKSSHVIGRSHSFSNSYGYQARIEAVNYALRHDDGVSTRDLNQADVILIGVSRCGKTPTCLYLALLFGVRAANYPLLPEDFSSMTLPPQLKPLRNKLYGLSINPDRLQHIRNERKPGSRYATLANCQFEVREAEALMHQEGINYIDTTTKSIEEIATTILHKANLERHIY
ncbi:MAG TPA: pyruvate, water dikinase regulatory protein [Burkholderiales bacterium]|nr:pyruvate, water dikinase regulatory protein [Burkholderiales bacterium]